MNDFISEFESWNQKIIRSMKTELIKSKDLNKKLTLGQDKNRKTAENELMTEVTSTQVFIVNFVKCLIVLFAI